MKAALSDIISKAPGTAKPRVVVEGFPTNVDQANKFESEVCQILLIISIVLESEKGIARLQDEVAKRDAKINWKRFEDKSEGLINKFRYQGNILEITGEWPEDEVWEQVEAKLESALELDDRGEL
ncbi:MAG: hypothetical protein CYPHOPRED_002907 [Cyphobasidiales sp. Tagirdzhanova-0007]|nr:MAG: hypothetical protein CYPHOPRED_002907 [Cyphobasidiales sp. Tagirdzhanova-0007]